MIRKVLGALLVATWHLEFVSQQFFRNKLAAAYALRAWWNGVGIINISIYGCALRAKNRPQITVWLASIRK